jgi:hypothetical protein
MRCIPGQLGMTGAAALSVALTFSAHKHPQQQQQQQQLNYRVFMTAKQYS